MFQTFETPSGPGEVAGRVAALRAWMAKAKIDAVLVPRADEHQGEYVPASAERLRWLTGFTGSAGLAAVTHTSAALFIDGRYTVQAKAETDTSIFDVSLLPRVKIGEWLTDKLGKAAVIGFDPWLHTVTEVRRLGSHLKPKGLRLKALKTNPVDRLWGKERPLPPCAPVVMQPLRLAGIEAGAKIAGIQDQLKADDQHAVVLTLPDSICWLFNMRGADVAHNPVVLAFAIVPRSGKPELFIDRAKLSPEIRKYLSTLAKVFPPEALAGKLSALKSAKRRVRLDANTAAQWFETALGPKNVRHGADPCITPKAIKSAAEIAGSRAAHRRDGIAMARFLAWLDRTAATGAVDEITAVKQLEQFRVETNELREISFATISGSGPNGAIVHYRVTETSNRTLRPGELFLIDSGGQYQDGTTDITRTVAIGEPTADMRRHFTAVLKGHIAIATARFPKGTRGIDLDPFARRALWTIGADFDHGTGHGIGSYLSVHEGPHSISRAGMAVLMPGMLISNEPGYYREGAFGIRIENVVLVKDAEQRPGEDRPMMSFDTLTLAPIDRRLIDANDLSPTERDWLNAYHATVRETLAPDLDSVTRGWLQDVTEPL